jgi:hypothetical protein
MHPAWAVLNRRLTEIRHAHAAEFTGSERAAAIAAAYSQLGREAWAEARERHPDTDPYTLRVIYYPRYVRRKYKAVQDMLGRRAKSPIERAEIRAAWAEFHHALATTPIPSQAPAPVPQPEPIAQWPSVGVVEWPDAPAQPPAPTGESAPTA